ncbi:S24 family peptidase [uncultured Capnocytophaga sp.]|jgi:phage repressor protein C with HTH and peptisase S24 domain|uniref:S24 family peptidase n=1 Tax=uncultured Capnocytophaga sp. TaxID=159273 RepID=UPI0025976B58|nr:S24 family peptidase [uncultured Capnocytophaga sp.]
MENNSKKQTNVSTGSSKRLEELLLHLKMSYNKFAKEIGLKDNVKVYHIKNGRNEISADLANAITATFPQISYQWLLTGNGEMLVQNTLKEEPEEEEETYLRAERNRYALSLQRIQELTNLPMKKLKAYDNGDENIPDDILEAFENLFQRIENEYNESEEQDDSLPVLITDDMVSNVKVPFYEVDFAGGFNSPEMFSQVKPSFVISSPSFAGADFACVLTGNSMSKRIKSGSVIGLKEIKEWWEYFPTNEIYAIVTKNGLRTVKIVKRSKKEGYIDLIPDPLPEFNNPSFEMETIRMNYVIGFYQVIAHAFYERMAF